MGGTVMKDLGKSVDIVLWLFLLGLINLSCPGEATPMPSPGANYGDMRSALKFLQDMDSYYGQIARPSNPLLKRQSPAGSEECPDDTDCDPGLSRFILLQGNDDFVSRMARPRFGKRSDSTAAKAQNPSDQRFMLLQGTDDSVSRLSRPRFGKRSDTNGAEIDPSDPRFLQLQDTDDSVSRLSRPRFGKRETLANTFPKKSDVEAFMRLQGVDDSLSRLSRPRFGKRSDAAVLMVPHPSEMYTYGGPAGGPIYIAPAKQKYYGLA